jgi:hypothetical protein
MKLYRIAAAILMLVAAASCTTPPKQRILGRWEAKGDDKTMEFKADQSVSMGGKTLGLKLERTGTYAFVDDTHIKVKLSGLGALAGTMSFTVAFPEANTLALTEEKSGKTTAYTRIP